MVKDGLREGWGILSQPGIKIEANWHREFVDGICEITTNSSVFNGLVKFGCFVGSKVEIEAERKRSEI